MSSWTGSTAPKSKQTVTALLNTADCQPETQASKYIYIQWDSVWASKEELRQGGHRQLNGILKHSIVHLHFGE